MGITERVEQLNRVLEAMNAWHATNGDEPPAESASNAVTRPPDAEEEPARAPTTRSEPTTDAAIASEPTREPQGEARPLDTLVDDLLPARRTEAATLEATTEIAESLGLGYHLGSAVERIALASGQGSAGVTPLREAVWLIERYTALLESRPIGADLHASAERLARTGDAIARLRALSVALEAESTPTPAVDASAETEETPPEPSAEPEAAVSDHSMSLGREIAFMAARWTIMVLSVIVVVLAVTLIGDWR